MSRRGAAIIDASPNLEQTGRAVLNGARFLMVGLRVHAEIAPATAGITAYGTSTTNANIAQTQIARKSEDRTSSAKSNLSSRRDPICVGDKVAIGMSAGGWSFVGAGLLRPLWYCAKLGPHENSDLQAAPPSDETSISLATSLVRPPCDGAPSLP